MSNLVEAVLGRVGVLGVVGVSEAELRKSTEVTRKHQAVVKEYKRLYDELAVTEDAIRQLQEMARNQQAEMAGASDALLEIAQEYENQTLRVKKMVYQVIETPKRQSPQPSYKTGWEFWMGRTEKVINKLKDEAVKTMDVARKWLPAQKRISVRAEESVGVMEKLAYKFRLYLMSVKRFLRGTSNEISKLETAVGL